MVKSRPRIRGTQTGSKWIILNGAAASGWLFKLRRITRTSSHTSLDLMRLLVGAQSKSLHSVLSVEATAGQILNLDRT